jgi:hypothetical protein
LSLSDNHSGTDKSLAKSDNRHDDAFATGRRFRIQIAAVVLIQIVGVLQRRTERRKNDLEVAS